MLLVFGTKSMMLKFTKIKVVIMQQGPVMFLLFILEECYHVAINYAPIIGHTLRGQPRANTTLYGDFLGGFE